MNFVADQTERLDKYLAAQTKVSRGRVQAAIKSGVVRVNNLVVTEPDYKVNPADTIELPEFEDDTLQPMEYDLKIVYENDDILVIDKPASLVVHPGAGHKQDTLSNALIARYPQIREVGDPARPGIVHRLDEDTSGLIVAAKTPTGYDYMKNLFLNRDIQKEYITLVHGVPSKLHGIIDEPIGRSSTHVKMKVGIGKDALTEWRVLATNEQETGVDKMALLRVKLHTGRTHQIRVHMAHIGHPIFGDQLYGGMHKKSDGESTNRQFLHAASLRFSLPDDTLIDLESPLPDELQALLKQFKIANY